VNQCPQAYSPLADLLKTKCLNCKGTIAELELVETAANKYTHTHTHTHTHTCTAALRAFYLGSYYGVPIYWADWSSNKGTRLLSMALP
jgi:hypothetical protein